MSPQQLAEVSIRFTLQGKNFAVDSKIIWENKGQNKKAPKGIGVEFLTSKPEIYDLAKIMLYNIAK
jgi:Tfp pilus assembly protein PilZ